MSEQQEMKIENSNIVKIGFIKCEDCSEQVICPHAGVRKGCRTKDTLKEVHWEE